MKMLRKAIRLMPGGKPPARTAAEKDSDPTVYGESKLRIPVALQAVFLASNRGEDVHQPPPGRVASRVFRGLGLFKRRGKNQGLAVEYSESSDMTNETFPASYADGVDDSVSGSSERTPITKPIEVRTRFAGDSECVDELAIQ